MKLILFTACCLLITPFSYAGKIVIQNSAVRDALVKEARVWRKPTWMTDNFKIDQNFNLSRGLVKSEAESLMDQNDVYCVTTQEHQEGFSGKTPKFYCDLLVNINGQLQPYIKKNGKKLDLKIKYHPEGDQNPEVYGEVLATRLLWAIGFGADSMFTQERVHCYGCTANPFEERQVDPNSMQRPRVFSTTVIEKKYDGDEIVYLPLNGEAPDGASWRTEPEGYMKGWSFEELMKKLSDDPTKARQQYVHRDALRIISVFIHHLDNKPENHRLVCVNGADAAGNCAGPVDLILQDVGSSFGVSVSISSFGFKKVHYKSFAGRELWKDAESCQMKNSIMGLDDDSMKNPVVSEVGRQFAIKLLDAFAEGSDGRQRVRELFKAARVERRGSATVEDWTNAFMNRLMELKYPLGVNQSANFSCPN